MLELNILNVGYCTTKPFKILNSTEFVSSAKIKKKLCKFSDGDNEQRRLREDFGMLLKFVN